MERFFRRFYAITSRFFRRFFREILCNSTPKASIKLITRSSVEKYANPSVLRIALRCKAEPDVVFALRNMGRLNYIVLDRALRNHARILQRQARTLGTATPNRPNGAIGAAGNTNASTKESHGAYIPCGLTAARRDIGAAHHGPGEAGSLCN